MLTSQGMPVIRSAVVAIDRDRRRVVTSEGAVDYDYLALTSGIRLAHEEVPGLAEQPDANLCPYDRAAALLDLRRRIAEFAARPEASRGYAGARRGSARPNGRDGGRPAVV